MFQTDKPPFIPPLYAIPAKLSIALTRELPHIISTPLASLPLPLPLLPLLTSAAAIPTFFQALRGLQSRSQVSPPLVSLPGDLVVTTIC